MNPATGTVRALLLAQARGTPMLRVPEAMAVEGRGFEGDRHFQRLAGKHRELLLKRQLLLLDDASREALRVEIGALKENVLIAGLPLDELPPEAAGCVRKTPCACST